MTASSQKTAKTNNAWIWTLLSKEAQLNYGWQTLGVQLQTLVVSPPPPLSSSAYSNSILVFQQFQLKVIVTVFSSGCL